MTPLCLGLTRNLICEPPGFSGQPQQIVGTQPEKAEPCYSHALAVGEKEFGANNPQIVSVLVDAAQLRKLARNDEADKLEKRVASLRGATMNPN